MSTGSSSHDSMRSPPDPVSATAPSRRPGFTVWQLLGWYALAIVLGGVAAGLAADIGGVEGRHGLLLASQVGFWAALTGVIVMANARQPTILGRRRSRVRWYDIPVGVAAGVLTQILLLPTLYLLIGIVVDTQSLAAPAEDLLDGIDGLTLVAMAVGIIVVAPVLEELFFRAALLQAMATRWGSVGAVLGSSVIFAATHLQALQFPGLVLAGLVFASAVTRTGRIGSAIAVHAGFNATTFVLLVA